MTQEPKKVSRRQAIKLLTATAGVATLASLPNKWVKPVLNAGVLPAHAQTSLTHVFGLVTVTVIPPQPQNAKRKTISSKRVSAQVDEEFFSNDILSTSAPIVPPTAGIQIRRTISILDNTHPSFSFPDVSQGPTDGTGTYYGPDFDLSTWNGQQYIGQQQVNILWEFVNSSNGTNTASITIDIIE